MRIVITGAAGRLGATLNREFTSAGHQVFALHRADLDITDARWVDTLLGWMRADAILNCAAYNAVDAAETNPEEAFALNAEGPANLARAARASGAMLLHYSSDFVFDGTARAPYAEGALTNPLSVYGASKLAGENEVRCSPRHYILRVESLFGGLGLRGHRATVDYIADSIREGTVVRAVTDRTVSPSHVLDVARVSRMLIERTAPFGTYHCVNSGFTTWYELAQEVSRQLQIPADIVPVLSTASTAPALRPRFCALSNRKLTALGIDMPSWKSALERHLGTAVSHQYAIGQYGVRGRAAAATTSSSR
jgi:dTDP-4-dehydrorhamnose reductase